jgi:type IV secretion system protein VirD4
LLLHPAAGSILATDPKGELATLTALRRARKGADVWVMDPFGIAGGGAALADPENENIVEDAGLVADAIVGEPCFGNGHAPQVRAD